MQISLRDYVAYHLAVRDMPDGQIQLPQACGRLFQAWVVTQAARIEAERLHFQNVQQAKLFVLESAQGEFLIFSRKSITIYAKYIYRYQPGTAR